MLCALLKIVGQMQDSKRQNKPILSDGVSLVELLIALTIISVAAIGIFSALTQVETSLFKSRITLSEREYDEAVSSYVYDAFLDGDITDTSNTQTYTSSELPADLSSGDAHVIANIIGMQDRYDGLDPKCALTDDADTANGQIEFAADCIETTGGQNVAQNINQVVNAGAKISFAIVGTGGRCVASDNITDADDNDTAILTVEDANCLSSVSGDAADNGSHILFPRFVTYHQDNPGRFYSSLIEPVTNNTAGLDLNAPNTLTAFSGIQRNVPGVSLTGLQPDTNASISLAAGQSDARIQFNNTDNITIVDDNTSSVTISGSILDLREALDNFTYISPDGYFGTDNITYSARSGAASLNEFTDITIEPNCGGETNGTAVRFDIGYMDNGSFELVDFITSVSIWNADVPQGYYGYCHNNERFLADGSVDSDSSSCVKNSTAESANEYRHASPRLTQDVADKITVFVYEENDRYSVDRFSLFFIFDDAPNDSGNVNITLDGLENGRKLDNNSDLYTFADDPNEYNPTTIANNTITMSPTWNVYHDGLVIPLRVSSGSYNASNLPELEDYIVSANPSLTVNSYTNLDGWNIRAVNDDNDAVIYREYDFNDGDADEQTTIQLNIQLARRCPDPAPTL